MDLKRYSKLIAALAGNGVAIIVAWAAVQFPAIAECVPAPTAIATDAVEEVCTVLGFSQVQITAALMIIVNAIFVERSPKNAP